MTCIPLGIVQEEALAGCDVPPAKNLFLKDKKGRLYIVTALPTTKVELPKLSARLGCGKGGLRFAPDDLLSSVLSVEPGCVTPLSLATPSAREVILLLDEEIRRQGAVCVHPLENSASLVMTIDEIERFLRSHLVGKEPVWVDFKAAPVVDRDHPPDLKAVADAATPLVAKGDESKDKEDSNQTDYKASKQGAEGKAVSKKSSSKKAEPSPVRPPRSTHLDVFKITESILRRAKDAYSDGASNEDEIRRLHMDIVTELNGLRNASYAAGFVASKSTIVGAIERNCC